MKGCAEKPRLRKAENRYKQAEEKKQRQYDNEIFCCIKTKKKIWKMPPHKSKSVAALPCNRTFAATHMLFCRPTISMRHFSFKIKQT